MRIEWDEREFTCKKKNKEEDERRNWVSFASKRQPLASGLILPDASHATVSFEIK